MGDIYLGLAVMIVLSAGLFFVVKQVTKAVPRFACDGLALLTVAGMVYYIFTIWDHVLLARLLPFSNLIVVGTWFLPAAGLLGGLVWRRVPGGWFRKGLFVFALAIAAFFATVSPFRGDAPKCHDEWDGDVCIQTSGHTCSAACAATLLKSYGIKTTEQEMAELCLTRQGTHWKGLYRGLKMKTSGTAWDVEVFECSLDELREKATEPIILSVELEKGADVRPIYEEKWGWIPGQPHSAVMFKYIRDNLISMGDPAVGREPWTRQDLKVLWHGQGFRLVKR